MTEAQYKAMLDWMRQRKTLARVLVLSGKIITIGVYIFYPLFLTYLFVTRNPETIRCLLVPAVSFVILSLIRYFLNFPRPYEKYDLSPLYEKSTKGKSFPSRHTFCIFIIAVTVHYIYPAVGIAVAALGVFLAVSRVLCGVHFIRDVLAGVLTGLAMGIIGFYVF